MPSAGDFSPDPHPCRPVYKPKRSEPVSSARLFDPVPRKVRKTIMTPEGDKVIEYVPQLPRAEQPRTGPPSYGLPIPYSLRYDLQLPKVPTDLNTRSGRVIMENNPRMVNLFKAWKRMFFRMRPGWSEDMIFGQCGRDSLELAIEYMKICLDVEELDDEAAEWFRCEETYRLQEAEEQWRSSGEEERTMEMIEDLVMDDSESQSDALAQHYECADGYEPYHKCSDNCAYTPIETGTANTEDHAVHSSWDYQIGISEPMRPIDSHRQDRVNMQGGNTIQRTGVSAPPRGHSYF